ncbi:MAG: phosphonoacetaldehyde hydrolase, partial [Planctomycetales bacterium]|nr:phosphonoacetaldehyde hydrolase [Planctomycetales bacterium]
VPETIAECRHRGLKIGSSTGYTRELMEIVGDAARQQGYQPDCVLCAEDSPRGRPAPYLIYEAAKRLDVFPLWAIVKVDDTPVGIEAGRNAGCWTVGVTLTGNGVGLSVDEVAGLSADERKRVCAEAGDKLKQAGAHYLVESVADLLPVLVEIDNRMLQGEVPINAA